MPIVENGKAVLADQNGSLKLVPEDQAQEAIKRFGWKEATPEDIEADDLQKEKGGVLGNIEAGLVSVGRPIASGVAAGVRNLSRLGGEVDAMGNPVAPTDEPALDIHGQDIAPGLYNESANRAVAANPTTAALSRSAPIIAGGILLAPSTGGLSLLGAVGLDAADAAGQAALDADLQGRDIDGSEVLRNFGLNLMFSGAGHALPVGAKAFFKGSEDIVRGAAKDMVGKIEEMGAKKIAARVEETVTAADEALNAVKMPKVISNRGGQIDALDKLVNQFEKSDPLVSKELEGLVKGTGNSRYKGLSELRAGLEEGSDAAKAIDQVLPRADLWGQKVIDHVNNLNLAKAAKPLPGATPDIVSSYAETLRKLPSTKLSKQADLLDELAKTSALEPILAKTAQTVANHVAGKTVRAGTGLVGGAIGSWPGAWIGQGIGELLEPAVRDYAQTAVPGATKYLVQAGEALKRFAENDRRITARLLVDPVAAGKYARVLGDVPTPMARFQGEDEHPEQAFDRWRTTLSRFKQDPNALVDALNEEFTGIAQQSPYLHNQLAKQAFKVSGFLQDKFPKPRGVSVARPNGTPPSPLEMRTFALYATAAVDPGSVLQDAKLGRLRREQVETLKALWPREYEGLRSAVVEQLGNGRSSTTTRQRLNLLFDFGSTIDPALGAAVSKIVNAARDASAAPSGGAPGTTAATPPSVKATVPAGESALQLGPKLDR